MALAWPIFFENFLWTLLGNVIIYMIGRHSDMAVAAVGVSAQLISMIQLVFGKTRE